MAYNAQFLRLTFGFLVLGTDEIAETSLHIGGGPGWDGPAGFAEYTQTDLGDLGGYYTTDLVAGSHILWAAYSQFTYVKLSLIDVDGTLVTQPLQHAVSGTPSGNQSKIPPQCSLLLSLWSGFSFGDANYGRMYLPHTLAPTATNSPYIAAADKSAILSQYTDFIHHVNTLAQGKSNQADVILVSNKGSGTTKAVAHVRSGSLVDTQRRRTNALSPSYSTNSL